MTYAIIHVVLAVTALPGQVTGVATLAGSIVLVLIVVAFGGFVYKSLTGDGITWPEDIDDEPSDDDVERDHGDDEWDYY